MNGAASSRSERLLRVAFVTTSFPVAPAGSSGIFVARLAQALAARVALQVVTPAPAQPAREHWQGIPIHAFRYAPRSLQLLAHAPGGVPVAMRRRPWLYLLLPAFLLGMWWACLQCARRADVIHANWAPTGVVAGLAGWMLGVPVVTTIRGEDALRIARSRLQRLLLRACARLSRRVVCVSEAMVRELALLLPAHAHRFECIPNGVGDDFRPAPKHATHASGPLRCVVLGSLIPRKNARVAIEAMALLPAAMRAQLRLQLVGEGPEAPVLAQRVAALGLGPLVEFVGAVEPEAVPALLAAADVMLLCSSSEGRPNAVLEGMAAGLPILASDIPGVRELVREEAEGLLFPVGDAAALARYLARMVDDAALRRRLGQAASERIAQLGLSWEAAAARYIQAYQAAIGTVA